MNNTKNKVQVVQDQSSYGIYVWRLPNGDFFQDDDGNTLNVPSMQFDIKKMKQISDAASYYGKSEGEAVFLPGVGRATEEQYREDLERMSNGYTPYGDTSNWRELFQNARK